MPRPLNSGPLLTGQSALNTAALLPFDAGSKAEGTLVHVTFGAGTTAGVVVIEGAPTPTYAGTWAILATITWAAASRTHETFIAGSYLGRRVRISTAIVNGTVDASYLITG
jgi:hypothetical protein